mgnify:CR=1 FL=1|jgi:hypothetical protein
MKTTNTMDGKAPSRYDDQSSLPDIQNELKGTKTADRNEIAKMKEDQEAAQRA